MRDLSPAISSEVEKPVVEVIWLAELDFLSNPIRIWNGIGQLTYDGTEWTGLGDLVTVSDIEETSDGRAATLTVNLAGIPSQIATSVYTDEWKRRDAFAWVAFLDHTTGQIIDEPIPLWRGLMDQIGDEDNGETATIILTLATPALDHGNNRTWRLTHEIQSQFFPGDNGLKYVPYLQTSNIIWGDKSKPSRSIKDQVTTL